MRCARQQASGVQAKGQLPALDFSLKMVPIFTMSADLLLLLASEVLFPASEQQHLTRMATTQHLDRFGLLAGRFPTASGHFSIEGSSEV